MDSIQNETAQNDADKEETSDRNTTEPGEVSDNNNNNALPYCVELFNFPKYVMDSIQNETAQNDADKEKAPLGLQVTIQQSSAIHTIATQIQVTITRTERLNTRLRTTLTLIQKKTGSI